jgi:hypothetical protein
MAKKTKVVWFMVFNANFNNISVISWWSVLLVQNEKERVDIAIILFHCLTHHKLPCPNDIKFGKIRGTVKLALAPATHFFL